MLEITSLDDSAAQQTKILLENGEYVTLTFRYSPQQLGWFFGVQYGDYNYQNIRLATRYNILRAYRNYLPFGLRCDTEDGLEPIEQDDFINGYATLYILNKDEVIATEGKYYAKTSAQL